ncbi:MAG: STAS domain-containing protein [Actinobacteria bacterium]|nr:STAS domain-containing protein [Actinomycetota bacterium]
MRHPQPGEREPAVVSVDRVDAAVVVRLGGELDLYNADQVRAALLEACAEEPERLVVDLAQVQFIDSTALGVLIEARSKLANRRGFMLAGTRLATRRALEVSGLDRHFALHDSADDALAAPL